jgi:peptidoglycan/LPS O-acetylase OafA/YrhL
MRLIFGGVSPSPSFGQYLMNMMMLNGFIGIPSIDGVYWSLFYEIRFYFYVFILLMIRQLHRVTELFGVWLLLSLLVTCWPTRYASYLLMPAYAHYFIAGSMFYLIYKDGISEYKVAILILCYFSAIIHAFQNVQIDTIQYGTTFNEIIVAIILASFFALFFIIIFRASKILVNDKWLTLGALSYPIYLLHQHIGLILVNMLSPYINKYLLMFGIIVLVLCLAYFVNQEIEKRYSPRLKIFFQCLLKKDEPCKKAKRICVW